MYYINILTYKEVDLIKFKTYNFSYFFNNTNHKYSIDVDFDAFKPGVDSLYFINQPDLCIAQISINDFTIILRPVGSCTLVDEQQGKIYNNSLPSFIYPLLDVDCEYNLSKLGISILERNHFEYVVCKKEKSSLKEYSLEFHKHLTTLDSSLDSFLEELKSIAIYFIQEDFLSIFEEDEDFLPCYALDDFEDFNELLSTEVIYSHSSL